MTASAQFMVALFDPKARVPASLLHPQGGTAAARFAVYRNNVIYGLMQNLRDGFSLLHALLGDGRFDALADAYARAHPPTDPLMFAYGKTLPDFIADYTGLADLPYAGDVARLDVAMRDAMHAADTPAMAPAALAEALGQPDSATLRLTLAACLSVIASDWPLNDLYLFLNEAVADAPDMSRAQNLMVYRQQAGGVVLEPLATDGARFLSALQDGQTIAAAAQQVEAATLSDMVQRLVQAGLITNIE